MLTLVATDTTGVRANLVRTCTFEYWWASPKVHRSTWTRSGTERTEWSTAEGFVYRKESGAPLRYFERVIADDLFAPFPQRSVLDSGKLQLGLKMIPAGAVQLACVTSILQWLVDGKLQAPSSTMPSYYCFEPSTLAVRITNSNLVANEFSQVVKTQEHYLSRQIVTSIEKRKVFALSVETIDGIQASDGALVPPSDAVRSDEVITQPNPVGSDNIAMGSLVKKTQPVYPMIAKMSHEQGIAVLAATIGTDGKIHNLEVLSAPSPLLATSAVDAVKKWEYKPYLLNGMPVEVETIVNVTYSLGQ